MLTIAQSKARSCPSSAFQSLSSNLSTLWEYGNGFPHLVSSDYSMYVLLKSMWISLLLCPIPPCFAHFLSDKLSSWVFEFCSSLVICWEIDLSWEEGSCQVAEWCLWILICRIDPFQNWDRWKLLLVWWKTWCRWKSIPFDFSCCTLSLLSLNRFASYFCSFSPFQVGGQQLFYWVNQFSLASSFGFFFEMML